MRIEKVTAHAFGPLAGETLTLAPAMTVVCGENEAAKSSWHAAVYAALCGRRRARGRPNKDDQEFSDRHRPWDRPEEWVVSCTLSLDCGRRIELRHDLAGLVDCRATDLALGRDVSAEIMNDGSPDGSRWLGLDRRSFAATASVTQAQLLSVLDNADSLQEHLQRAAANANTDSTAAQALDCLQAFQREHVGQDRRNSTRPLRLAKDRLTEAKEHLEEAERLHRDYLAFLADAQECREASRSAGEKVSAYESEIARLERLIDIATAAVSKREKADRLAERLGAVGADLRRERNRLERARQLHAALGGKPPTDTLVSEHTARQVSDALSAWKAAPAPIVLTGKTASQLAEEIAALPDRPDGDTAVHDDVRTAVSEYDKAAAVLEEHLRSRPAALEADADVAAAVKAGPQQIRELIQSLATPLPEMPDGLANELEAATTEQDRAAAALEQARQQDAEAKGALHDAESALAAAQTRAAARQEARAEAACTKAAAAKRRRTSLAGAAVAALAVSAALFAAGLFAAAAVCGIISPALLAASALTRPSRTNSSQQANTAGEALREKAALEQRLAQARQRVADSAAALRRIGDDLAAAERAATVAQTRQEEHQRAVRAAEARREKTAARCAELGVPGGPERLTALAAEAERAIAATVAEERWREQCERLHADAAEAERRLRNALAARGADGPGDSIQAALRAYEEQCRARAEQAAAASRRVALTEQHHVRREREHEAALAEENRAAARAALLAAAQTAEVNAATRECELTDSIQPLLAALEQWQEERIAAQAVLDEKRTQWSELQTLLDGAGIQDLAATVAALEAQNQQAESDAADADRDAQAASARLTSEATQEGITQSDPRRLAELRERVREALSDARRAAGEAADTAATADGGLAQRAKDLPSVAEAEEALSVAQSELDRVEQLDSTLSLTQQFLRDAQERVHRDIAPVLAENLRQWLPRVTGGRYTDAMVDPSDLRIRVCGSQRILRQSDRLSRGTAEQVYLLLRIALARHLATRDESCPLLLDDVTVQSDAARTLALLDLLHELSAHQQVILFAQESLVADWARRTLTGPEDSVITLEPVASQ
uniref:AAA family ATPase n=1 Tax=Streptomyces sp. NPDC001093 TaxID=3154376 RepID=UPI003322C936